MALLEILRQEEEGSEGSTDSVKYASMKEFVDDVNSNLSYKMWSYYDVTGYDVSGQDDKTDDSFVYGADPSDIHTYVDCGEIVQYSPLTGDGDFGDVEIETIVDERYVTIYADGTYYYMFDYMNDMITIAYME